MDACAIALSELLLHHKISTRHALVAAPDTPAHTYVQGCTSLTDVGLAAIGHMTSLTNVNLQDCRQITGATLTGHLP